MWLLNTAGIRTSFRYLKIADKIAENCNIDFSIGSGTTEVLGGRVSKTQKKKYNKEKESIK